MKNIIIVDMQKGFLNKNNEFLSEKINEYLANNKFENVFYTKFKNNGNSFFETLLCWDELSSRESQEFAVNVLKDSKIFEKTGYGLTFSQIEELKSLNIKEIEICGTDVDACVLAIMFNLFDAGIKPVLLKDLTASSTNKNLETYAFEIIKNQFGEKCFK